jgi:hypothetical protein
MQDFKNIETMVLLTMLAAHSAYHGITLTKAEMVKRKTTIGMLQEEIASRENCEEKIISSFSGTDPAD